MGGRVTLPKRPDLRKVQAALEAQAKTTSKDIKLDFEATVSTWEDENRPTFAASVRTEGKFIVIRVEAASNDEIYRYVNNGTRPHLIPKAGPRALAFSEGYSPKTTPGLIKAHPGGPSGNTIVRKTQIKHPGTEARYFDKAIAKKWQDLLGKVFGRAFVEIKGLFG